MDSGIEGLLGGLLGGSGSQGGLGGLGQLLGGGGAGQNQIVGMLLPAVAGMLAGGGLGKLMSGMQSAGLEDKAKSWISAGENHAISPDEVKQVVDPARIADVAQRAGVSHDEASALIAKALPAVVDHVTPDGTLPDAAAIDQSLGKVAAAAAG
jgi:uncharacterized protein YidB (DUF937 family)